MEEDLTEIAARMRDYAFAHPLDPVKSLANPRETDQYSYDTIYEGLCLRFIFTIAHLSTCSFVQLSLSEQPNRRAIPPALADEVRDAFFEPDEIVSSMPAHVRNDFASLIGQPRIADDNTEQFFCKKPHKGA